MTRQIFITCTILLCIVLGCSDSQEDSLSNQSIALDNLCTTDKTVENVKELIGLEEYDRMDRLCQLHQEKDILASNLCPFEFSLKENISENRLLCMKTLCEQYKGVFLDNGYHTGSDPYIICELASIKDALGLARLESIINLEYNKRLAPNPE